MTIFNKSTQQITYLSVSWYGSILVYALIFGLNVSLCKKKNKGKER